MPLDDRPIFLVGFMGSGKSTLARLLARELGWDAVETDDEVARRAGRSVERIFADSGEAGFRELEREVLDSLAGRQRAVVATGGGMFSDAAARRSMKRRGRTVWLDVPLAICARRVGSGLGRPLWKPGDPVAFRAFFERRRAVYALAELRLASAAADPAAWMRQLLGRL